MSLHLSGTGHFGGCSAKRCGNTRTGAPPTLVNEAIIQERRGKANKADTEAREIAARGGNRWLERQCDAELAALIEPR